MTKLHETKLQKEEERKFAKEFAEKFGGSMCELPFTYKLDYYWERENKPDRWIEIKRTTYESTLPELMCGLVKLQAANSLYATTGYKSFLIYICPDKTVATPITNLVADEDFRIWFWGREDRHKEPQVMIPNAKFKELEETFGD